MPIGIFCLVRTDTERKAARKAFPFCCIDMKSPGITVKPIIVLDGGAREVNEVFFDNVMVPADESGGGGEQGLDLCQIRCSS